MKQKQNQLNKGEIIIYKPQSGDIELNVKLNEETVWLSLDQMTILFGRDKSVISRHIKNVFNERELEKKTVVANFATTAADGKTYQVDYYNLDVIISVGYRVKSHQGVQFRIWATQVLKKYLVDGYAINEKRLEEAKNKFKQLQNTIQFLNKKAKVKRLKGQEKKVTIFVAKQEKKKLMTMH